MARAQQSQKTSSFALQDSSLLKVDIPHAVSSNLLGSSSIFGRSLLESVKQNASISAANFNLQGSFNILTNPLTYPEYVENGMWLYSLTQKGFTNSMSFNGETQNQLSISLIAGLTYSANNIHDEKVRRSDVSLSLYNSILELKSRYIFDEEVASFLLKTKVLISFLNEAFYEMSFRFPNSEFVLKLKLDPEISDWTNLYLNIVTSVEDLKGFEEKFQDFIQEWMFKQSREIKSLVTIVDKLF